MVNSIITYSNNDIIKKALNTLQKGYYRMSFEHQKSNFYVSFVIILNDNGFLVKNEDFNVYDDDIYNFSDHYTIGEDSKVHDHISKEMDRIFRIIYYNIRRSSVQRIMRRYGQTMRDAEIDFEGRCASEYASVNKWTYYSELFIKIENIPESDYEEINEEIEELY